MKNITQSLLYIFVLCSLLNCPTPNTAMADDLTAHEILSRMKKVYENAQTYRDKGLVKMVIRFPERVRTVKKPFSTAFIRPGRFRFEFNERESFGKTSTFIAYQSGQDIRVHWDLNEEVSQIKTIGDALATGAGISGGSARTVPTLLLPAESRFTNAILLYSPKRTVDEVIDGVDCYRIEDPNDYRDLTLWIDKEEFLLRKIYTYRDLQDSKAEITTTYTPVLNGEVTEKMLEFGSPQ